MLDEGSGLPVDEPAHRVAGLDLYVALVAVAAVVAVVAVGLWEGLVVAGPQRAAFAVFAVLFVVGEVRTIKWLRLDEGGEITTSWVFAFGLLLLNAPGAALVTVAIASAVGDASHRKPFVRTAFNAAQLTLSLAAAHTVLSAFGHDATLAAGGKLTPSWFVAVVLASAVLFMGNGALTCVALALHEQTSVAAMLRRGLMTNLTTDGAMLALSPCFVVVSQRSLLLLPLALVTATLVYRSSRAALTSEHAASHDVLTELLNRRAFDVRLREWLATSPGKPRAGALLLIDLDGFKGINDRLGHSAGDVVLQETARRIVDLRQPGLIAARLGGDEFAVLLTRVADARDAEARAWEIHAAITRSSIANGFPIEVGASIGVAIWPEHGEDQESLLHAADIAMYEAKRGHDGVRVAGAAKEPGERGRIALVAELAGALEREELVLHYQPQVDVAGHRVLGVEALVRWQHPVRGLVAPGEFMPLAEHTELIGPITQYVLRMALEQAARWNRLGLDLRVAVNASAGNLHDRRFPDAVARLLAETGVPASSLEIEITENTVISDPEMSIAVLQRLRDLGVHLAIDDFGTGYSSFASLRDLPVDTIKIDRSFVQDLGHRQQAHEIVRTIISLAHGLGMTTIAEGVEDSGAYLRLRAMGCEAAQGFLIGRPMPHDDVAGWIHRYLEQLVREAS